MPSNRYPFIARESLPLLILLIGIAVLAQFVLGFIAMLFFLLLAAIAGYLFRDPDRIIPSRPLAVLSPVYGVVTLVEEDEEEIRLGQRALRIQIETRITDVYSLRSPIEGKVIETWCSAPDKNESRRHFDFYIKSDEGDDVVTAIRLRDIIRRFHTYLHCGERVGHGQRCGYLFFGCTVDIFLPLECKVQVEPGEYVESGSSILARLIHSDATTAIQSES